MKKLKILFWIIGVLIVLCVGAVLVITTLVDPNDFKPKIAELVESKTGRALKMHGDLDLTFYPWIGISTGAMELSNRAGFGDTPMISVEQANIKIRLVPLLQKRIEAGTVILNSPRIHLTTRKDGTTNWEDLMASARSEQSSSAQSGGLALAGLVVQGVSLVDGEIVLDNGKTGQSISLSKVNLSTGQIEPGIPLELKLSLEASGATLPGPVAVSIATTARVDQEFSLVYLNDTAMELEMEEKLYMIEIPTLEFNVAGEELGISDFNVVQGDLKLAGALKGTGLLTAPAINGKINLVSPDLGGALAENGVDLTPFILGSADLNAGFTYLNDSVEVNSLLGDLEVNGQDTKIEMPFASLDFQKGKTGLPGVNVRQSGMDLSITLNGDRVFSGMENLRLTGTTKLQITDLQDFLERNQLGDLLPQGLASSLASELNFAIAGGIFQATAMQTKIDETEITGDFMFSDILSETGSAIAVKQDIQKIDVGRILTALDISNDLEGTGSINLNLAEIKPRADSPMQESGGEIMIDLRDGAIKGFDLQAALVKLDQTINRAGSGDRQSQYQPQAYTRFSDLTAAFKGQNGRFSSANISLKAPGLRVKGRGTVDLPNQLMDFAFDVSVVDSVEGQGGADLANLRGVTLPLVVKGSLTAPGYGLNVGELLKREAEKEIKKEVEKKVTKKLLDLLGD